MKLTRKSAAFLLGAITFLQVVGIAPIYRARASTAITITSSAASVIENSTIRYTANIPVTWSLAPGSVGSIDADGTYHAPATITANNVVAGCQMLPNDNIFNTRIDTLPVDANSNNWISQVSSYSIGFEESWDVNLINNSTPSTNMNFLYTPQNNGSFQIPSWPNLKQEGGAFASYLYDGDRHITSVNTDNCQSSDIYSTHPAGADASNPATNAQSGVKYDGGSHVLPNSGATDAAGMLLQPLSIHLSEIEAGVIKHAVRFTLSNSWIAPRFIWPATGNAYPYNPSMFPYGSRVRLKSSYDISSFSPIAQVVLTDLKNYGMVLADGGSNFAIQTDTDVSQDPAVHQALKEISVSALKSASFELVDESSLEISATTGAVKPSNSFVTPTGFAMIIAADVSDPSNTSQVPVNFRGAAVGTTQPAINIASGASTQLSTWVTGVSNASVSWSMSPSVGTLSSDGLYTAPTVSNLTKTLVTISSVENPSAKTIVKITVVPKGNDGGLHIKLGPPTSKMPLTNGNYGPDSKGNIWWFDPGSQTGGDYPGDSSYGVVFPDLPDIGLDNSYNSTYSDWIHNYVLPNGNYAITFLINRGASTNFSPTGFPSGVTDKFHIETQGQIVASNYDVVAATNNVAGQRATLTVPAQVTNGNLYFALRRLGGSSNYGPMLNAVSIIPTTTPAHLSVQDSSGNTSGTTLTAGKSLQFSAIGWYMPNSVNWSISPQIGFIDSNGLYSAPSSPPNQPTNITVTAISSSDPTKQASATVTLVAGSMSVSPSSSSMNRSAAQQFTAAINGTNYTNVSWSVSPQIGSINSTGLYTAPDSLSADAQVTVTATSNDNATMQGSAVVTVRALASPIRVHMGDIQGAATDSLGNTWDSDYGWTNIDPAAPSSHFSNNVTFSGVASADQFIYRGQTYTNPYTTPLKDFYYSFAVPDGDYKVVLRLGSYNPNGTIGQYVMNVLANGVAELTNFDIVQKAGGDLIPVDQTFNITVNTKNLRLDFNHVGTGLAAINGVEIIPLASSDTVPPVISAITSTPLTQNTAGITWTTNESADTQVEYGTTVSYGNFSALNVALTTAHTSLLSSLAAGTLYHYIVKSRDAAGNLAVSADNTFSTLVIGATPSPSVTLFPISPTTPAIVRSIDTPVNVPTVTTPVVINAQSLKLIQNNNTVYLVIDGVRHGIANPGIMATYGFTFSQVKPATSADLNLPEGSLLTPQDGSLVKSKEEPTVYFIANQERHAFTSSQVFSALGFKFSSVLVVTNPELQVLPKTENISNPALRHLRGVNISDHGTIYFLGQSVRYVYPNLSVYNSWNIPNDFSQVVPANAADLAVPIAAGPVEARVLQ